MARDLPLRRTILSVTLVALSFVLVAPVAVRAESVLQSSFLKYAPADTAFYVACLRNREQVDIVKNSKAYERLMQNPFVMIGLGQVKNMWANPTDDDLREFKEFVEAPENQPLWKLMEDMVSDEIVFFGSGGWIDMVEFLSEKGAEFQAKINEFGGDEPSEEEVKEMIEVVAEYLDEIDIPDTVVAFQVNDTERAAGQLDRLEDLIRDALAEEDEELAGDILKRLKREKVAGGDFLTLSLDGKLIPWDEIKDEADLDAQGRELLEKIIPVLNKKTLVISLGIYKEYVLLSFGDSHAHIKALGKGKLLADTETFAPLGKHADKPITGIVYASEEMAQAGAPGEAQIDSWLSSIRAGLNETEIDEETKEDIITDANLFFAEIVAAMPEPGAYLDFTFLTDRGYEGYTYNWTENPYLDSTKPLNILQHVGSNPLFFYASRGTSGLEEYEWAVKWLKKAGGYVDRICEQELDQEELAQYRTVRKEAIPLLARLDKANRDQLIPGFADGSSALVFDAKVKSKKWHEELPESQTPTRMPEIAIVCGVSNAKLVKQGCKEYHAVLQDALDKLHEFEPDEIPEIDLPAPEVTETDAGSVYRYPLPEEWGLDEGIAPSGGISEKVAVGTMFPESAKRLLTASPLTVDGPPANYDRPLAAAAWVDFAGMIDLGREWMDYGFFAWQQMQQEGGGNDAFGVAMIKGQTYMVLDLMKCFRGYASASYKEEDAMVTHYEILFKDLN